MFESGDSIKDYAVDALFGGLGGFGGRYVYDRFIGTPLNGLVGKYAGKYADVLSSYLFDLALNFASRKIGMGGEKIQEGLRVAGYVPFADALGRLAGDAAPMIPSVGGSSAPNWGSLNALAISSSVQGTV